METVCRGPSGGAPSASGWSHPGGLYTATESQDISFRQIHDADCHIRINQQRWCPVHEEVVGYDEIVRGYEYEKDQYVILDDEDFEQLPLPSKHTIDLTAFVKAEEIDPVYYEKTYYLEPEETGVKPFALLMRALQEKEPHRHREDRDPQQGAALRAAAAWRARSCSRRCTSRTRSAKRADGRAGRT